MMSNLYVKGAYIRLLDSILFELFSMYYYLPWC